MKTCTQCKNKLLLSSFYLKNGKRRAWCKLCHKKDVRRLQQEKRQIINELKKECKICGFNKYKSALHFHHHQNNKEYKPTGMNRYSIEKLKKELTKCVVICANCHAAIHNNEIVL